MKYTSKKLLLLCGLIILPTAYATGSLLGCNKVSSTHDFNGAYSKQCFNESLKKYHAKLDYKFESSQKISLPIIRNFVAGRVVA